MTQPQKFSLAQQIEEVERELGHRRNVYPRLVASHSMRQSVADFHTARMDAVKRTLEWLRSIGEDRLREIAAGEQGGDIGAPRMKPRD